MADVHDPETRSYNMSRVKGKNTKPEILVRKFLHKNGLRFRMNDKKLPGKPDIKLTKYKTVIFVNGCFWHMHENCKYFTLPKTRTEWWSEKLSKNVKRDKENQLKLKEMGWHVLVIWACELKGDKRTESLDTLYQTIIRNK